MEGQSCSLKTGCSLFEVLICKRTAKAFLVFDMLVFVSNSNGVLNAVIKTSFVPRPFEVNLLSVKTNDKHTPLPVNDLVGDPVSFSEDLDSNKPDCILWRHRAIVFGR